jgi:hypothetical protein
MVITINGARGFLGTIPARAWVKHVFPSYPSRMVSSWIRNGVPASSFMQLNAALMRPRAMFEERLLCMVERRALMRVGDRRSTVSVDSGEGPTLVG